MKNILEFDLLRKESVAMLASLLSELQSKGVLFSVHSRDNLVYVHLSH